MKLQSGLVKINLVRNILTTVAWTAMEDIYNLLWHYI
jgi:hypothetical protein